jgi:hypothetical protein
VHNLYQVVGRDVAPSGRSAYTGILMAAYIHAAQMIARTHIACGAQKPSVHSGEHQHAHMYELGLGKDQSMLATSAAASRRASVSHDVGVLYTYLSTCTTATTYTPARCARGERRTEPCLLNRKSFQPSCCGMQRSSEHNAAARCVQGLNCAQFMKNDTVQSDVKALNIAYD